MSIRLGINLLTCNLAQCPIHWQATDYCLRSLLDSDVRDYDWQLQIVDNGSTCPHTLAQLAGLEQARDRMYVERLWENVGIAKARNRGYQLLAERHAPQYVVEVHTDMVFPRQWLGPMLNWLERPEQERVGLLGASLFSDNVGRWTYGRMAVSYQLDANRLADYVTFRTELERKAKQYRRPSQVMPGLAHPCVRRWQMVEQIGIRRNGMLYVYDPDLPGKQNYEDTEEAYRAYLAGWQSLIFFGATVYHHYHFSRLALADHPRDYDSNNIYCQEKHGPGFVAFATATLGGWMDRAYGR